MEHCGYRSTGSGRLYLSVTGLEICAADRGSPGQGNQHFGGRIHGFTGAERRRWQTKTDRKRLDLKRDYRPKFELIGQVFYLYSTYGKKQKIRRTGQE